MESLASYQTCSARALKEKENRLFQSFLKRLPFFSDGEDQGRDLRKSLFQLTIQSCHPLYQASQDSRDLKLIENNIYSQKQREMNVGILVAPLIFYILRNLTTKPNEWSCHSEMLISMLININKKSIQRHAQRSTHRPN